MNNQIPPLLTNIQELITKNIYLSQQYHLKNNFFNLESQEIRDFFASIQEMDDLSDSKKILFAIDVLYAQLNNTIWLKNPLYIELLKDYLQQKFHTASIETNEILIKINQFLTHNISIPDLFRNPKRFIEFLLVKTVSDHNIENTIRELSIGTYIFDVIRKQFSETQSELTRVTFNSELEELISQTTKDMLQLSSNDPILWDCYKVLFLNPFVWMKNNCEFSLHNARELIKIVFELGWNQNQKTQAKFLLKIDNIRFSKSLPEANLYILIKTLLQDIGLIYRISNLDNGDRSLKSFTLTEQAYTITQSYLKVYLKQNPQASLINFTTAPIKWQQAIMSLGCFTKGELMQFFDQTSILDPELLRSLIPQILVKETKEKISKKISQAIATAPTKNLKNQLRLEFGHLLDQ